MKKQIIKPIDGKQEKMRKTNKLLNIGLLVMFIAYTLLAIWMGANFDFQSPVVFRSPMIRKVTGSHVEDQTPRPTQKPTLTPEPTKKAVKKTTQSLVTKVYAAENESPTDEQIVAYIKSKDWDDSIAVRLAKSENFYNKTNSFDCTRTGGLNSNGTRDHGIFQINDIHIKSGAITLEDANDCYKNIDFAYGLYKSRGNFTAWSAYNNKSYLNHTDEI